MFLRNVILEDQFDKVRHVKNSELVRLVFSAFTFLVLAQRFGEAVESIFQKIKLVRSHILSI
ncbi:hypothetical protein SFMTTN_1231 [Sulfuriferula multivorans]|uniref:Uncharacterized protein n=1 Tax=Sulfuriferula multivorans TaxID=1559896 RepID=A0A401JCW0_9PROT|nr:hypothetical protein SFMTTN_1231 [Sulfuriferula multivorans]